MKIALLKPSQIVITSPRAAKSSYQLWSDKLDRLIAKNSNDSYKENFKKKKQTFGLSNTTKKKIATSINTMLLLSKNKTIKTISNKTIRNLKLTFTTLTLPAPQIHSDTTIKKECLNQFLTELRQQYNVRNYVWKAELQKNSSIHFHLILDTYVDYFIIRRIWNRIVNKLDYVDRYSNKFNKLSFSEYSKIVDKYNKYDSKVLLDRYVKGKIDKWQNPNSVDVKFISNRNQLVSYIQKYLIKNVDKDNSNSDDIERILKFGRVWSRSESLSKLQYKNWFDLSDLKEFIDVIKNSCKNYKEIVDDYYTVIYYDFRKLSKVAKDFLVNYIYENARMYNYKFPIEYE